MRATILFGFVGLVGISSLSGCGFVQSWHGDTTENGARRVYVAPDPPSPSPSPAPKANTSGVVIQQYPGATPAPPPNVAPRSATVPPTLNARPLPVAFTAQTSAPPPPIARPLPVTVAAQTSEPPPFQLEVIQQTSAVRAAPASPPADPMVQHAVHVGTVTDGNVAVGHAEKFWTVTGTVEEFRKNWRVRYAGIDQEDRYGGVVVLDGGAELNQLRDGMHVRVRGTLLPTTERTGLAHYRVKTLEILD